MAAVEKFSTTAICNILRHNNRQIANPSNKDIDPLQSQKNYSLLNQPESSYDLFLSRKKDLYCYKRQDVKVLIGWVVTLPKNYPLKKQRVFFECVHQFLIERYGENNCVQSVVHNDESGQPHLHFCFIPSLIAFYHQGMDFINICEKIVFSSWKDLFFDIDESNCPKASQYINSFQGASEINTAGCKQSCDAVLKLFATNEQIKKTVRRPDKGEPCFFPDTLETNSVFVVIQDYCLKLYAPLLHLITSQCFEFFSQRNTQATHTILLALDEFASFGYLDMTDALRKLRKKHVRIMVLSQSLADLDLIYGSEERKAMINNFRFRVLLGATDADTQEYFSKLIGYKITTRRGVSRSGRGKTTSVTETKDYAVEPSSLAQLKDDLIVLSDDGYEKLQKNYYFKKR